MRKLVFLLATALAFTGCVKPYNDFSNGFDSETTRGLHDLSDARSGEGSMGAELTEVADVPQVQPDAIAEVLDIVSEEVLDVLDVPDVLAVPDVFDVPDVAAEDVVDLLDVSDTADGDVLVDIVFPDVADAADATAADEETADACVPNCEDKDCGDDGCGGSCGQCDGAQQLCAEGICVCIPKCSEKDCGDDGCGGACGVCGENQLCTEGKCGCAHAPCGETCCPADEQCNEVMQECCILETCHGNEVACGPMENGCGVEIDCGECIDQDLCDGELTCQAGECVNGAPPDCDDHNPCTDDSCTPASGACVQKSKANSTPCEAPLLCVGQCQDGVCQETAEEECNGEDDDCDEQVDEGFADSDSDGLADCVDPDDDNDGYLDEADCETLNPDVPSCEGKECGDDGCGGSCGECDGGANCQGTQCICTPFFAKGCEDGKKYNYDSCGNGIMVDDCDDENPCTEDGCPINNCTHSVEEDGTPCGNEKTCQSGSCIYKCGDGVCAGVGGETCANCPGDCGCEASETCFEASCCTPDCMGKECGDDGCGGSCPSCLEGFVQIDAGSFWMGSPNGCPGPAGYTGDCTAELGRDNNEVLHYAKLTNHFELQVTEVTQGDWKEAFDGWNPSDTTTGDNHPVESVSWFDACALANWKSEQALLTPCYVFSAVTCEDGTDVGLNYKACLNATQEGIAGATVTFAEGAGKPYDCEGFRLPTDAEWEYAARAGTLTAYYDGQGGDNEHQLCEVPFHLEDIAWYCGNDDPYGHKPVGGKAANGWGLKDMTGNVWEWCSDGYVSYLEEGTQAEPAEDPHGAGDSKRVKRGGYFHSNAWLCRSAIRVNNSPDARWYNLGFRLARTLPPCGDNDCSALENCATCPADCGCDEGDVCFEGACCLPTCNGKDCGNDGCGGSCGECLPGQVCINSVCPINGKQCNDGNDVDWDGCTNAGEIAEFQVNEYANAGQSQPDVASLSSGGYVTVWTTHHDQVPGDTDEVFGRIFTKSGAPAGEEFMVNTFVADGQYMPRIAGLQDGGFVVVWQSQYQDNDGVGVFGQRYSPEYSPVGEEFQANTVFAGGQGGPDICALDSGGFIVTWYSEDDEADGIDIKAQAFNSQGAKQGEELQVNAYEFGHQKRPSIASSPSGNALVVWESEPAQDGDGLGVFGRIISGDGALVGSEFPVNTYSNGGQLYPVAASTAAGGYAAFWQSENQFGQQTWIVGQAYNSIGGKTTGEFQVSVTASPKEYWARPDACSLADGRMVVVWQRSSGYWKIAARLFSSNAVPEDDEFQVNQFADGSTNFPVTASTGDGGFVIVWVSDEQDGSSSGIFAQRFDKDGNKLYK